MTLRELKESDPEAFEYAKEQLGDISDDDLDTEVELEGYSEEDVNGDGDVDIMSADVNGDGKTDIEATVTDSDEEEKAADTALADNDSVKSNMSAIVSALKDLW